MGFQQLYTEQQVVNIIEQIGSKDMGYWLKAVDSVFLGIAPEIEILKAPITVTLASQHLGEAESWGGVVNNNYSYDLIEGKNYVVKATVGKLSGESQEVELSAIATLSTSSIKQPLLSFAVENDLHFTLEDKVHFKFTEPYYTEGEDFSLVSATDGSSKPYTWSYVTVHSLIQKEATSANLLKEPIVVTRSNPFHQLNYPLGLEVGKSYNITLKLLGVDGTETEKIVTMAATDAGEENASMKGAKMLRIVDNENNTYAGGMIDGAYIDSGGEPVLDANKSLIMVYELDDTVLTSITFTSIVQKEKTSANLLKEPIVVTKEEIDAGGDEGVQKTLNKAIGLEIGKIYDLTIVQNGVETIVPASAVDGKSILVTAFSFPYLATSILSPSFDMEIYDGVDTLSEPVVLADKADISFNCYTDNGAFELTSIKEHANLEDWSTPLVVTIDNPQKIYYYKYYNKTGSLFTSAGQNVKVTGSLVVDGQAHSFEVENTTRGDTGAYYVDCANYELDQSFTIADGAYSEASLGAFPASYMTLEINNSFPEGSPMSELRIDSITVT